MHREDSRETKGRQWGRAAEVEALAATVEAQEAGDSVRSIAAAIGVPRSTLRSWLARKESVDLDPDVVGFFESPAGLAWLHRLVLACIFVFGKIGPCGLPMICAFLKLSGISHFVAASVGSVQKVSVAMTEQIIGFGAAERSRLAAGMPKRRIAVVSDENFHEGVCLLAIEPASDFILLEALHENREAATWDAAMKEALSDLPVTVVVGGSDEAPALKQHISKGLGAQHAPDLFHGQREIWRAMEPALAKSLKAPRKELAAAETTLSYWQGRHAKHLAGDRGPGRPPHFERHIAEAMAKEETRRTAFEQATGRQIEVHATIRGISEIYHPVDLETGTIREAAALDDALGKSFAVLDAAADAIHLADKQRAHLDKARRLRPTMVSHLAFFWNHVDRCLVDLEIDGAAATLAKEALIPGLYLRIAARRARLAGARRRLSQLSDVFLAKAMGPAAALASLPKAQLEDLQSVAREAVDLFVRATSCVEGRNGRLSLLHHGIHLLGTKRRQALTILHNFAIHRLDGSTPASRFFRQPHRDLFAYLLDQLDLPARPRPSASRASALTRGWAEL